MLQTTGHIGAEDNFQMVPLQYPYDIALDTVEGLYYLTDPVLGLIGFATMVEPNNDLGLYDFVSALYRGPGIVAPYGVAIDNRGGYPNAYFQDCYGHGQCLGLANNFKCDCFEGWFGDCRMKGCPKGRAWFDEPVADGDAHHLAECSNVGTCDYSTGTCQCREGFTGPACEFSECPSGKAGEVCSGHGHCLSMHQAAVAQGIANYTGDDSWEVSKVLGCVCTGQGYYQPGTLHKDSGWKGGACELKACPSGDPNPHWGNLEVQQLECDAQAATDLTDSFTLSFRGHTTGPINTGATRTALKSALERLSTIGQVSLASESSGAQICSTSAVIRTNITFLSEYGDLPVLEVQDSSALGDATVIISTEQKGSKVEAECSAHGICDEGTGECQCFSTYASSDGRGNIGTRADCGFPDAATDFYEPKSYFDPLRKRPLE